MSDLSSRGALPSEPVELAPTETAGQQVALSAMGRSRMALLTSLKNLGDATADQLAADLGITVGAVRQLLGPLGDEGLVAHHDERQGGRAPSGGRGRPRRWYCLTPAAETLFPKRYGQLTNQLLGFIESADPSLVAAAFVKRGEQRRARAQARMTGLDFEAKVHELAQILDEDGYLANCERIGPNAWRIAEHNCAVLDVAREHREACGSELSFIRAVLPEAHVERVTHILSGAHSCSYEVTLAPQAETEPA